MPTILGRVPTNNRVTTALRMAASTLGLSNTYLKATAAKLARLVYRMLRYGMKYLDQGAAIYEAQHRQAQIKYLKWKAAKLGYQIVQAPAA